MLRTHDGVLARAGPQRCLDARQEATRRFRVGRATAEKARRAGAADQKPLRVRLEGEAALDAAGLRQQGCTDCPGGASGSRRGRKRRSRLDARREDRGRESRDFAPTRRSTSTLAQVEVPALVHTARDNAAPACETAKKYAVTISGQIQRFIWKDQRDPLIAPADAARCAEINH